MVLAVVFLNLAGGDCVEDLERLETGQRLRGGAARDRAGFAVARRAAIAEAALATRTRADGAITVGSCRPGWSVSMIPRHRRRLPARRSFRR